MLRGYTFRSASRRPGHQDRRHRGVRAKLAENLLNLEYPVWVDDDGFDLNCHLLRIELPAPGGRRELAEIRGHIASCPLDRDRPPWEMWVIEGVAETTRAPADCWR